MMPPDHRGSPRNCLFKRRKFLFFSSSASQSDVSAESIADRMNTFDAERVIGSNFCVSLILRVRCLSKVAPAVIVATVRPRDVINLISGPRPFHQDESDPVS
jgi:hypothetical protein